jgi:hypothetical protein
MPSLDIFNDDAFSTSSLTARVNKGTYRPGQVSAAGIFEEDGVTTTSIFVEERDGKDNLHVVRDVPFHQALAFGRNSSKPLYRSARVAFCISDTDTPNTSAMNS